MRLIFSLVCLALSSPLFAAVTVADLKCEGARNPMGVDVMQPRLSWVLQSDQRGTNQSAFQVLASSSAEMLGRDQGDLWDSGNVKSDQTLFIPYQGRPLATAQQVFWKVRVFDDTGNPSPWSSASTWTMGILKDADWAPAKWIGAPASLIAPTLAFQKQFDVKPQVHRAVVFVCGLGQYEMSLNGSKVGNDLLTPGWTKYDKTCLYDAYDVTSMLQPGANRVGLLLGNGMYNVVGGRYAKFKGSFGPQKAIALLRLEYSDGTVDQIGTDEQWQVAAAPITFSCVYGGEDYDARLESPQWLAAMATNGPGGALRGLSCQAPPIREIESLKPVKSTELKPGATIYDLGQNASVMLRMSLHGPAGSVIKVIPAELLKTDGTVDRTSSGNGQAYWQYTLKGSAHEGYFSKFYYHGSRYFQVERSANSDGGELPVIDSIEGVVVHSSSDPVGEFSCSNELFNQVRTLIRWAQRSNMMSVLTDCPHRERLGWIEQDYLNGPSLRYEFDLARFYTKGINDMSDSQTADGLIPDIAPEYTVFQGGFRDSPEWGSAFIQCAWQQYEWTGSLELLDRYYDGMKRYVEYLKGKSKDNIVSHGLGDWYDIGPARPGRAQLTPLTLTATAIYYSDIKVLEQTAILLKKNQDAKEFGSLAKEVRDAFNKTLFNSETGVYSTGSQTANAMVVALGLSDEDKIPHIIDAIAADVSAKGLTSGDIGYRYLLRALAQGGRSDVIYAMNNQSDKPGYGYQLKQGATALTEAWDARAASSQNHFMLGHINEWFYHELAGIQLDPDGPGFKKIIIKPALAGDLTWVKGSYNSVHGKITSEWKRDGDRLTLYIIIPPNTAAMVFVPAKNPNSIEESGKPVSQSPGVKFVRAENGAAVYSIPSGTYTFSAPLR